MNEKVINKLYKKTDKKFIVNGKTLVDALPASSIAKNDGIVLVGKNTVQSILKDVDIVQIGEMDIKIEANK